MAVYVPKYAVGNLPAQKSYFSDANNSSARKYTSKDAVQNNNPTDSTSNTEHILKIASGIRALTLITQAAAEQARKDAKTAIDAVLNSDAEIDPTRQPGYQYTEEDVSHLQERFGAALLANISGTAPDGFDRVVRHVVADTRFTFVANRAGSSKAATNSTVPVIDSVVVDLDPRKGATDSFYAGIAFNIPTADVPKVKLVRVFRAEVDPVYTRPLASLSAVGVQQISTQRGMKNRDNIRGVLVRLEENGVSSAVSRLGYENAFTGQVNDASSDGSLLIPPPIPGQIVPSNDDPNVPEAFHHLDRSVTQNINVLFNLQSNPVFGYKVAPAVGAIDVGNLAASGAKLGSAQRAQTRRRSSAAGNLLLVDGNNKLMFQEIAQFSPSSLLAAQSYQIYELGNTTQMFFADDTVTYGGAYKYFVVTVNEDMVQSPRSAIVDATIEAIRVPPRPSSVVAQIDPLKAIGLTMISDDQLVEKFEIHRQDTSPNRKTKVVAEVISGQSGFSMESVVREMSQNGFVLIGEVLNNNRSGGSFLDTDVVPGHPYVYRVYTVDIFGNKSESPFELTVYVTERRDDFVPLKAPSILAEVDSKTRKAKITFSSNEPLVQRLRLERRDLTIGEADFTPPGVPSRTILGYGRSPLKNRNSLTGELLAGNDPLQAWTGFFQNVGSQQVFIDQSVQLDHVYQYRIFGEDRYGNRTSYGISSPVLINRRPFINSPVNLNATLVWDSKFNMQGVQLTWQPGSIDVSAGDLLGNQTALKDSSIRTLYQVQRRLLDQENWENFPLTPNTSMLDSLEGVAGDIAPNFRPPFPQKNRTYQYRVQAVQIGNYVSNFTEPVSTFVGIPIAPPESFVLRTPPVYRRPFYVMLNWDTPTISGVVDRWDIERCSLNNYASSKINFSSSGALEALDYKPFRSIFRESSRFSGRETDPLNSGDQVNDSVITGMHYYMDTQVDFGNSYFYRIRAVDINGNASSWVYRGMKVTSSVFENTWSWLFTDQERRNLAVNNQPLVVRRAPSYLQQTSRSLLPSYAAPESVRISPRIKYNTVPNS